MKRLFVVSLQAADQYVMAASEYEAEDEALRHQRNGDVEMDAVASAVQPGDRIPDPWLDSYPWGGDCGRNVAQIMETLAEDAAKRDAFKAHPKLFPDVDPEPLDLEGATE